MHAWVCVRARRGAYTHTYTCMHEHTRTCTHTLNLERGSPLVAMLLCGRQIKQKAFTYTCRTQNWKPWHHLTFRASGHTSVSGKCYTWKAGSGFHRLITNFTVHFSFSPLPHLVLLDSLQSPGSDQILQGLSHTKMFRYLHTTEVLSSFLWCSDSKDSLRASIVEDYQFLHTIPLGCPGFRAIQKPSKKYSLVHLSLGPQRQVTVPDDRLP